MVFKTSFIEFDSVIYFYVMKQDFKLRFMKKWNEAKIDALLCPVLPFAALKLGNEKYFTGKSFCLIFHLDVSCKVLYKFFKLSTAKQSVFATGLICDPSLELRLISVNPFLNLYLVLTL